MYAPRNGSSSGDALPERVGEWYGAGRAPWTSSSGTTTACSVLLGSRTLGISDPVIPGAKIYIGFGDQDVLTR
jgi:hypothetical protein